MKRPKLKMETIKQIYLRRENSPTGYEKVDDETEDRIWEFIFAMKNAKENGENGAVTDQTGLRIFMAVAEYLLKHDGKKHPLFAYPKKGGVSMTNRGGLPTID